MVVVVKRSSDVAAVMKRESNDSRQEVEKRGEVVEDCALFIPADTSESLIHLKKGISQVTSYLVAFAHMHTRTTQIHNEPTHKHIIVND